MGVLKVERAAEEVGFDPVRLERIGRHFRRYVDDGLLPGWSLVVARSGSVVHLDRYGHRDVEAGLPVEPDTIFRIYSMSKPVTSVAAMMLWEEGAFQLKDPVSRFIPSFAESRVWRSGSVTNPSTDPLTEPMLIWHLLTHTAGLTYGFLYAHPVDELYRRAGFDMAEPVGADLADVCDRLAGLPLLFQPGREWNYSMATDVLGRVVEVVSGQTLDEFCRERIFEPLGMIDTGFMVPADQLHRLAALYMAAPRTLQATRLDVIGDRAKSKPDCLSGGGGLVSTLADYHRFTQMLLNEGELDGCRLLGSRTVELMAENHLPGDADLTSFGRPLFAETAFDGVGFGLGFSVALDPVKAKVLGSPGEIAWGGMASTAFWVDPVEEITAVFLTQLMPSSTHPLRPQLRQLVYQALVD
jgi:CubicO group peptidase (beta-lactamase class C family)